MWAANCPEWVLIEFGAALAGLTLVTVNPAYLAKELAYVLTQSKAVGLIVQQEYRGRDLLAVVEEVRPGLTDLRRSDFAVVVAGVPGVRVAGPGVAGSHPRRYRADPVYLGHHGIPQGRPAAAPQSGQQRALLRARHRRRAGRRLGQSHAHVPHGGVRVC